MFYSVLFFLALTILVLMAFMFLNKSTLQFEEKLTSKSIIILLFSLVVIMNQLQVMSQFRSSNQLLNLFSPMDLIPLSEHATELSVTFNKTKGIYFTNNHTLPHSLQLQFEQSQKPYLHLNFDESSALNIDTNYLEKKMNQLQNLLMQQQQQLSILMIRLETINIQFLEYLEQIFDQNECIIIVYGSKINQSRHVMPSIYRFSQQLTL